MSTLSGYEVAVMQGFIQSLGIIDSFDNFI